MLVLVLTTILVALGLLEGASAPLSLAMAGLALFCLVSSLRRRARSLESARTSEPPQQGRRARLRAGETTVAGRVEYEEDRDVAMRVEIVQEGSEQQGKNAWSHTWAEVSRTITATPFFVVTEAGERVHVEPDEVTLFWDEFEQHSAHVPTTGLSRRRARVATLSRGEQVWVSGRLYQGARSDVTPSGDYRDQGVGKGWVMRSPPTLFVSTVPLVAHHQQRASLHTQHAVIYAVFLIASLLVPLGWADRSLGTTEEGRVTGADVHRGKNNSMSWTLHVETPSGTYREKVSTTPTVNQRVSVRRGRFSSNLGSEARSTPNERIMTIAVTFLLLSACFWMKTSSLGALPWYRRPGQKFVETGSGRLS